MNPLHTIYLRRILLLFVLMSTLVISTPLQGQGSFILNADDIEARKWMNLSSESRAAFVFGFLAGLDHLYESTGLVVALSRPLSAMELADEVYKVLLEQPELRSGPIDNIILTALENTITIKNKAGLPVSPGMKEVSTDILRP